MPVGIKDKQSASFSFSHNNCVIGNVICLIAMLYWTCYVSYILLYCNQNKLIERNTTWQRLLFEKWGGAADIHCKPFLTSLLVPSVKLQWRGATACLPTMRKENLVRTTFCISRPKSCSLLKYTHIW